MALKTRRPTGAPSWPLILLAGEAKTGKTWAAAEFTGDERVGRSFWLDLGEGCADEYGSVPGADYEILEHDGTWVEIIDQVESVRDYAREALAKGEKPVTLTIDSMTAEWAMLTAWTDTRARKSKRNEKLLKEDPDAEIDITSNYWNDANSRHNKLVNILKTFPGIVIMTALETEKTQFDAGGRPKAGAPKVAKPDAQKRLAADSTAWVRLSHENAPTVVGLRSVQYTIQPGVDKPRVVKDFTLAKLVFDLMKIGEGTAVREVPVLNGDELTPDEDPNWEAKQQAAIKAVGGEVMAAGNALGWDTKKVLEVYASENNNADLYKATLEALVAFRDDLKSRVVEEAA
ncbi:AAA family ATPase [Amycolatopsis sp. NPDC051373]|uniref:AAA family ATPase n=1 Tax=Amycolatopsis sp. NPDC051373 TaxID=3155801 RepID=UPI0034506BFE